ncbi:MAG: hypothetical protein ACR2GG_10600 [Gemmatimonadaceae bacterium]
MIAPAYVDVVGGLVGWTHANVPGVMRVFTEAPANLADVLPAVRVGPESGSGDAAFGLDAAVVDFDCFAVDYAAARDLAGRLRTALRFTLPGQQVSGAWVTAVDTASRPHELGWDNTNLRRVGFSVDIYLYLPSS